MTLSGLWQAFEQQASNIGKVVKNQAFKAQGISSYCLESGYTDC